MKKNYLLLIAFLGIVGATFSQPVSYIEAPPFDNSTTQVRAPNGLSTQAYMRACALVLGTELTGITPNSTLTSFGFTLSAPASANVTGTMAIYLENTTDVTYTKGLTFSTAITPMTLVYNNTITVPGTVGTLSVTVNLSTPFTYTGGGLYVAYDWFSLGPFATTPATYRANSTGLIGGCASAAGTGPAPTTLGSTSFRPCFLFGVANTYTNEVQVQGITAPGSVPSSFNTPHSVLAYVRNASANTLTNIPVTLSIGGANPSVATQTIASLAAGVATTVTFAGLNPQLPGLNTISVTVPSDQNNVNNLATYNQSVTCSEWAINPAGVSYTMGSVGFNTGSGIIASTYSSTIASTLLGVRGAVSTNAPSVGNNSWGVLLNSTGAIVATTNTVAITAGMLGTFNTYSFATTPTLAAGATYYIGFAQPTGTAGYFPMGTYTSGIVPFTNYVTTGTVGGAVAPLTSNLGYFGIEALFAPNMSLTVTSPSVVCGAAATLTASVAGTYTWSTGPSNTSITVTPTVSTIYTVVASNTLGCVAAQNVTVTVNPLPINANSSATVICIGSPVTLTASGAPIFNWSTGATTAVMTDTPTTTGVYTLTGSNAAGCSNSVVVTVGVVTFSTMLVSNSSMTTCLGNSLTLSATGANSYTWNTGAATSTGSILFFTPNASAVYSVTGADPLGCEATETIAIIVNSFTPGITSPTAICIGEQIVLTATGGAPNTYTWSNNSPFQSITMNPTVTTSYSVTAVGNNGCPGYAGTTVTVNPLPNVVAVADRGTMCKGETATLTASGASTYSWSTGAAAASTTISPTINITQYYSVSGKDVNGCSNTGTLAVVVNACTGIGSLAQSQQNIALYPNPNNGIAQLSADSGLEGASLTVYNALGQQVLVKTLETNQEQIDLTGQPAGIYIIAIGRSNSTVTLKLIKN